MRNQGDRDVTAFLLIAATVFVVLICCVGLVVRSKTCDIQGGHFEIYWDGKHMTCVGGER